MICYHGTSADHLESILKNGLYPSQSNWTASEAYTTYFWSPEDLADADREPFEEDPEQWHNRAFDMAGDSAFFSLGVAKDCRRIIIAVNLRNPLNTRPDESCQNMDGAVCVTGVIHPKHIVAIWADEFDLSMIKGYFLGMREGMDLAIRVPLNDLEQKLVKAFKGIELTDELYDLRWKMKQVYTNGKPVPIKI